MCRAEQNKSKTVRGDIYTMKWSTCTLSYNGAKTAARKHSFKNSAINGRAKGGKIKRNCGHADREKIKKIKI